MTTTTQNILIGLGAFAAGAFLFKSKDSGIGSVEDIQLRFPNYHVLKIKYLGPTNYTGSRVKIISERFEQSKTIDYDHKYSNINDMAAKWLIGKGFNILGYGEAKDGMYIISDTFEPLKGE